jgi:hypothetical protein
LITCTEGRKVGPLGVGVGEDKSEALNGDSGIGRAVCGLCERC